MVGFLDNLLKSVLDLSSDGELSIIKQAHRELADRQSPKLQWSFSGAQEVKKKCPAATLDYTFTMSPPLKCLRNTVNMLKPRMC